jgi:endogenous inhibitor of DNA gyrase (YacG/DUF329 family)
MTNINFQCPYCGQPTTITDPNRFYRCEKININEPSDGEVGYAIFAITCPNESCNKLFLKITLGEPDYSNGWRLIKKTHEWQLLPESSAKVLPEYIPNPIKEDYIEACRIKDLSPKASATLSRRCLQGMIRDFWGIKKGRLKDEVDALEEKVDSLTWDAIDSVRKVGNIGAHMEKDINLVIDVEPKEAQLLIELIEQLVVDWYVERFNKEQRLSKIKDMAKEKDSVKNNKQMKENLNVKVI